MPRLLSDSEVSRALKELRGWRRDGRFIVKKFEFKEFIQAIDFVVKVAGVAEKEEHHPDINVRYTEVTLSLQTHSEGGVTEWDVELAGTIERMIRGTRRPTGDGKGR